MDIDEAEVRTVSIDKIKEYVNHLDNHESTFSGLRYFNLGRMIMINTDDLYISFKGTADYIVNTECNNEENKLGLNWGQENENSRIARKTMENPKFWSDVGIYFDAVW